MAILQKSNFRKTSATTLPPLFHLCLTGFDNWWAIFGQEPPTTVVKLQQIWPPSNWPRSAPPLLKIPPSLLLLCLTAVDCRRKDFDIQPTLYSILFPSLEKLIRLPSLFLHFVSYNLSVWCIFDVAPAFPMEATPPPYPFVTDLARAFISPVRHHILVKFHHFCCILRILLVEFFVYVSRIWS